MIVKAPAHARDIDTPAHLGDGSGDGKWDTRASRNGSVMRSMPDRLQGFTENPRGVITVVAGPMKCESCPLHLLSLYHLGDTIRRGVRKKCQLKAKGP